MPQISIILPTYNGSEYIRESIDSIFQQSYSDWELIIVNDCSTDDTLEIIKSYEQIDGKVRIISNSLNLGLPKSLNVGMKEARGKYVTWTSDDNCYLKDALKVMNAYLEKYEDIPMVCTNMLWMDNARKILHEHMEFSNDILLVKDVVGACFLYRKCVIHDIGEYDQSKALVEDYDYWLRIRKHYGKIGYIPGVHYLYRYHAKSLTGRKIEEILKRNAELLAENIEWIFREISNDKFLILELFHALKRGEYDFSCIMPLFLKKLPILKYERSLKKDSMIILYGNGINGKKCYEKYKNRVKAFTTTTCESTKIDITGIPIIPLNDAIKICLEQGYQMIITPGVKYQEEMMNHVIEKGLKEFVLYAGK